MLDSMSILAMEIGHMIEFPHSSLWLYLSGLLVSVNIRNRRQMHMILEQYLIGMRAKFIIDN